MTRTTFSCYRPTLFVRVDLYLTHQKFRGSTDYFVKNSRHYKHDVLIDNKITYKNMREFNESFLSGKTISFC